VFNRVFFQHRRKKLKIIFDASVQLPSIRTDKILLRRVLVNVLDNGVKFSLNGGELTVATDFNETQLSISVKNYGPQMSDNELAQLFKRFWQTKGGREKRIGVGLGLFSSKQIMDALGGQIQCLSTKDGGTTFMITMPLTELLNGKF